MQHRFDDKPLYGRKDELLYLQGIVHSVLRDGAFGIDHPSSRCTHTGSFGDCNCTVPTDATSHQSDDDFPVRCEEEEEIHHHSNCTKDEDAKVEDGRCHLVLLSGPPGSGKRTLVTTVLRHCQSCAHKSPFLMISARFRSSSLPEEEVGSSRTQENAPFAALKDAFQEMAFILSQQGSEVRRAVRQALRLGEDDVHALCDLIPNAKRWLIPQVAAEDESNDSFTIATATTNGKTDRSTPPSADHQFASSAPPIVSGIQSAVHPAQVWFPVLQAFLHAVVTVVPVVFLLEEVQYADETSRHLIQSLMQHHWTDDSKGLIFLATYSDEDGAGASSNSLLSLLGSSINSNDCDWKKQMASSPNIVRALDLHHIPVSELTWEDVREWVQHCDGTMAQCSAQQRDAIADLVVRQSHGIPLLIQLLLQFLRQDEALWQEPIHTKWIPTEVNELFLCVFLKQEEPIQRVIQVAALIAKHSGGDVDHDMLEFAMNAPCEDIIETAHWFGFLEYSSTRPTVYFFRDSFQKAVLDTILDASLLCLEIGRRIWSSAILRQDKKDISDEEVQARVLLATQLLRSCIELLSDIDERIYMSQLCYEAGLKSSSQGSFYTSVKLFEFAIDVLGTALWRSDLYEASLVLHNAAAQAYCSTADYEKMRSTLDTIFDHAKTFQDKLPAYLIQIYSSGSGHQLLETSRISSMVLQELGEPVSEYPSSFTIFSHLFRVKWALRGKTDRFLINLPMAEDADFLVVAQLLSFTQFIGYMAFPTRTTVIGCRLILSALKRGICGPSAFAFTGHAFFLCAVGNFKEANHIGQLVMRMADRFGAWWPRLQVLLFGYVNHWKYPLRDCLEPQKRVQRASLRFGDFENYALSSSLQLLAAVNAGMSLDVLEPMSRTKCLDLAAIGQTNQLLMAIQVWSFVNDLQGGTKTLGLSGKIYDASSVLKHCIKEGNKFMGGNSYIFYSMWYYLIGEYEQALHMTKKSLEQRQISDIAQTLYQGLSSLAVAWTSKSCLYDKNLALGRKSAKCMKRWADYCPENFRNKQWLLEAEIAALKGQSSNAVSLFLKSIDKAKQESFFHEEATAYERLGHFQHRLGNAADAKICFSNARAAYQKWGASVLVDRMDDLLASNF